MASINEMTKTERVMAAVNGEEVDRIPVCFWHHFRPEGSGRKMAEATLEFFDYTFDLDTSAWGWIHLIVGAVVFMAGLSLLAGAVWAQVVAITLAVISAVTNFFFIPYYPFWSIVIIALNVWVIWALTRPGLRTGTE